MNIFSTTSQVLTRRKGLSKIVPSFLWLCFSILIYSPLAAQFLQIGEDIDGEAAGDRSGHSVSLSSDGTVMAIGAPFNDGNGDNAGHVRVYRNVSGTWMQVGRDIDSEASEDLSGSSISLNSDGTVIAIGAPFNDGNGEVGSLTGHVRVYRNVSDTWTQIGQDIDGEEALDLSGTSVSLSSDGSVVAIGAPSNSGNGNVGGSVRVFRNASGTWTQVGQAINGEELLDFSGTSVSLSSDGSVVAIGAPWNDGNGEVGSLAGHVRVYRNVSDTWTQVGEDINGEAAGDQSGTSVSLSSDGSVVAIGAPYNAGKGDSTGHVRVYRNMQGVWTQVGQDIDGEELLNLSGASVSLSSDGSVVAIGAPWNDGNGEFGFLAGHVRIYRNVSDTWTRVGQDNDGEAAYDESGSSVSLSSDGSTVAIGAWKNDGNGNLDAGHVRVYDLSIGASVSQVLFGEVSPPGRDYTSTFTLTNTGAMPFAIASTSITGTSADAFRHTLSANEIAAGASIDIEVTFSPPFYGDYTAILNINNRRLIDIEGQANNILVSTPHTQIGDDIGGEAADDESGTSVSLSADGTVMAIGAPFNDGNGDDAGHVRVYRNVSGIWTQVGQDIDGEAAGDWLGSSVSLSADGSVVAIGAIFNDGSGEFGSLAGHVRVYRNVSGTWTQIGQDIDGEEANNLSGTSVSLSSDGSVIAIGAPSNRGDGNIGGHVRVYRNVSDTWAQVGQDINGEETLDLSGISVSLSSDGSVVAIGAPWNNGNKELAGHVRVYRNVSGIWTQVGQDIDGEAAEDWSGYSVSLSSDGTVVAIGAPYNDDNEEDAGHVRVYRNVSGTWTQVGQDIDGEAEDDELGTSVSLSADGTVVAIGAPYNDGNDDDAGHVRVYRNVSGTWTRIGQDIDGEAEDDESGSSVSLSADGTVVAIGAPHNGGNGEFGSLAGHVRVYRIAEIAKEEVTISSALATAMEGGNVEFTLRRTVALGEALTINVEVTQEGEYIAGTAPTMVDFAAGEATATLTIATTDDETDEEDGSITVTIKEKSEDYTIGMDASAEVTVTDNDVLVGLLKDSEVVIYPNPVKEQLYVRLPRGGRLSVYTLSGRRERIYRIKPKRGTASVDVSDLASGLYVVTLTDDSGQSTQYRVVKE